MSAVVKSAVPTLRVKDVGKTMEWYKTFLGLAPDPFPDKPPYEFAILWNGSAEIMLKRATDFGPKPNAPGWDVYIRIEGGKIRELFAALKPHVEVVRELQLMPYLYAEFDIRDPDGFRLCFGEEVGPVDDIPKAVE